jgi:hypothetical protein
MTVAVIGDPVLAAGQLDQVARQRVLAGPDCPAGDIKQRGSQVTSPLRAGM